VIESILPENFDRQAFLRDYWQKKPLLIRAGALSFIDPISPEELAGLACENGVEARLIQVDEAQRHWSLRNGPFTEQDFLDLPPSHYSLLVQAVDHWVDGVSALLEDFDFIPGWRVDDVMISYATDQGNVGPHFDYYDVFLIQGLGQKRWQTGQRCDHNTPIDCSSGLRLLTDFQVEQEYMVYPGDILYLPPGIAHYGVAEGNAITYSVGFRAPACSEIIGGIADDIIEHLQEDQRYTDLHPRLPEHPGEIPAGVVSQLQELWLQLGSNPDLIRQWFGRTMTRPRYPVELDENEAELNTAEELGRLLASGAELYKVPGARFAYSITGDKIELFADGECYATSLECLALVQSLSKPGHIAALPESLVRSALKHTAAASVLLNLYNQGTLVID
jgi:50S ribosomal protein L16 3-hydroxylase